MPFFPNTEHISISFSNELFLVSHFSKAKKVEGSLSRAPPCVFFHVREMWVRILEAMGDEQWTMHIQIQGIHLSHINSSIYFFLHIPIHFIYTRSHPETRKKVSENANDWNIIFREMAAFVLYGPHTYTPLLHSSGFLKMWKMGCRFSEMHIYDDEVCFKKLCYMCVALPCCSRFFISFGFWKMLISTTRSYSLYIFSPGRRVEFLLTSLVPFAEDNLVTAI